MAHRASAAVAGGDFGYLESLAGKHPSLPGYDLAFIVGIAPGNGKGEYHILELDRKAHSHGDGRLSPIAFAPAPHKRSEYVWITLVSPEDLAEVLDRRDKSLTQILKGTKVKLLWPEPEGLGLEEAGLYNGVLSLWEETNACSTQ